MKKLVTLLLAAGLVFSAANGASAVELKATGQYLFGFNWGDNIFNAFQDYDDYVNNDPLKASPDGKPHQKHFDALQRVRVGLDFVMSENLSAHYAFQVGAFSWGGNPAPTNPTAAGGNKSEIVGGRIGTRAANIVTRLAYLDWMVPNTSVKVRMGQQQLATPGATFVSPVLGGGAATGTGIVVSAPVTDNIGVTAMWVRALSDVRRANGNSIGAKHFSDNTDLFALVGDLKFDGIKVQPWAMVGLIGKDSGLLNQVNGRLGYNVHDAVAPATDSAFGKGKLPGNATAWWVGLSGELTMFDPFRLTADFIYNAVNVSDTDETARPEDKRLKSNGWYAALGAEYKTAWGTPALKGWYASGDDKVLDGDHEKVYKKGGRMLGIVGGFNATTTMWDKGNPAGMYWDNQTTNGTWGISAQWNGLSFVENLSHSLSVTYVQGTNDKTNNLDPANAYLTTKDSFVEIDLDTEYKIYKNLSALLQLSYMIEDFDGKNQMWNVNKAKYDDGEKFKYSDAWRASLIFNYTF